MPAERAWPPGADCTGCFYQSTPQSHVEAFIRTAPGKDRDMNTESETKVTTTARHGSNKDGLVRGWQLVKGWWFPFDLLRLHSLPLSLTSFSTSLIPCGTFYLAKATAPRRSALLIHSLLMCVGVLCVQTMAQRPVLGICKEHTAVDTCNCTVYRGLYKRHESLHWQLTGRKKSLATLGVEPVSTVPGFY